MTDRSADKEYSRVDIRLCKRIRACLAARPTGLCRRHLRSRGKSPTIAFGLRSAVRTAMALPFGTPPPFGRKLIPLDDIPT